MDPFKRWPRDAADNVYRRFNTQLTELEGDTRSALQTLRMLDEISTDLGKRAAGLLDSGQTCEVCMATSGPVSANELQQNTI
jgi:hypothetical protein